MKRPRLESLKSKARLIIDARKRKNLTHLQSILLFKDSRESRKDFERTGEIYLSNTRRDQSADLQLLASSYSVHSWCLSVTRSRRNRSGLKANYSTVCAITNPSLVWEIITR